MLQLTVGYTVTVSVLHNHVNGHHGNVNVNIDIVSNNNIEIDSSNIVDGIMHIFSCYNLDLTPDFPKTINAPFKTGPTPHPSPIHDSMDQTDAGVRMLHELHPTISKHGLPLIFPSCTCYNCVNSRC